MEAISKESLKIIFKKVKNLRFPKNFESIDFTKLHYLGWIDETDQALYTTMMYNNKIEGIKWDISKFSSHSLKKSICDVCCIMREAREIIFVTSQTRKKPKNIEYRTRGKYICINSFQCNNDIHSINELNQIFSMIIDQL